MSSAALTCPPSRHGDVVVTLLSLLPGAVNSTANVLDIMQDNDDDERYTPVTVTESPAATIPAEPSAGMTGARSFRSFEDARAYVRTLGLKSKVEWNAWRKSGARPHDIPSTPHVTYKASGWTSYADFLGYAEGKVTCSFRTFEGARTYVRTLNLKSAKEWWAWCTSDARLCDIPGRPDVVYASSGWLSYGDFLGYADGITGGRARSSGVDAAPFGLAGTWTRVNNHPAYSDWRERAGTGLPFLPRYYEPPPRYLK